MNPNAKHETIRPEEHSRPDPPDVSIKPDDFARSGESDAFKPGRPYSEGSEYPSESSDALHDLRERLIECADEIAGIRAGFLWFDSIKARDSRLDRRLVNKRRRLLRHILRDLRRAISCESGRTETGRVSGTKDAKFEDLLEELLVVE